jgi:hypothetical protein
MAARARIGDNAADWDWQKVPQAGLYALASEWPGRLDCVDDVGEVRIIADSRFSEAISHPEN